MKIRQDDTHDTVYFSDIMWYVLSKWRSLIVTAVVLGLILGGYSYLKSSRNAKADENLAGINVEERIKNSSDEVRDVAERRIQADKLQEYIDNGMLMNMDSMSVGKVTLTYYVADRPDGESQETTDMKTTALSQSYAMISTGEKVRSRVTEEFDGKITENDLDYLLTVTTTDNTFSVVVKGPDDNTCTKISEIVKTAVDEARDELCKSIGIHSVELIDESHTFGTDDTVSEAQKSINKAYSSMIDKIESDKLKLDSEGQELLDAMAFQAEERSISGACVSKKYVAIGIILGLIIAAVIHIIRYVYTGRVVAADQVYHTCKAPVIGEITAGYAEKHTALDRKLYCKLFGIKKITDMDKLADCISMKIAGVCRAKNVNSLYVVNGVADDDKTQEYIDRVLKKVSDNGIRTGSGYDDGCDANVVEGISGSDAVVIMTGLFVTEYSVLSNQVAACRQQNKEILGTVVWM